MNDDNVLCIECGNEFNVQNTTPCNGGRICAECEMTFVGRPEDEKCLNFDDV